MTDAEPRIEEDVVMVSAELHDEPVAATTTTTTTTPSSSNDKENRGGATTGQAVAADAEGAAPPPPKFGAYQVPLVEKYRPKTLDQVVGNEGAVERLQSIARQGNVPNLILCGPPGTGKTTSVHALARQLLGPSYKDAVLELNASDARGIDVVRNRIKSFAMNKVTLPPGRHKIVILDEADSMTSAAQQALRRTMELFSNTTRFCLACNVSTKIIEAIQSRAAILRYARLSSEQVLEVLLRVCQSEHIAYTDEGLEALLFTAEGDVRQALNNLQASHALGSGLITPNVVYKVCDTPHPSVCRDAIAACSRGDAKIAIRLIHQLHSSGYSSSDLIGTLFKVCKSHDALPEALKLEFLREIGFCQLRISADGVNSLLQLLGLVSRLSLKCQ